MTAASAVKIDKKQSFLSAHSGDASHILEIENYHDSLEEGTGSGRFETVFVAAEV